MRLVIRVKEEHVMQLKGENFMSNSPLDRLRRNGLKVSSDWSKQIT